MPDNTGMKAQQTLQAIERAIASEDLDTADQLSRILHAQVREISSAAASLLLQDLNRVSSTARSRREELRERLKGARSTRQGVTAYQSVTG